MSSESFPSVTLTGDQSICVAILTWLAAGPRGSVVNPHALAIHMGTTYDRFRKRIDLLVEKQVVDRKKGTWQCSRGKNAQLVVSKDRDIVLPGVIVLKAGECYQLADVVNCLATSREDGEDAEEDPTELDPSLAVHISSRREKRRALIQEIRGLQVQLACLQSELGDVDSELATLYRANEVLTGFPREKNLA